MNHSKIMQNHHTHPFTLGKFECVIIQDYAEPISWISSLFENIAPETWHAAMREMGQNPDTFQLPYHCLAVNAGQQWVLIDAGLGTMRQNTRLLSILQQGNIDPKTIVISHAHPDHYGGLIDADGNSNFPDAQIFFNKNERDYFLGASIPETSTGLSALLKNYLTPVEAQLTLIEGGTKILTGFRAISANGHSPHHMAILIESNGEKLLYAADAFVHPLHINHLDWEVSFDADKTLARAARQKLATLAVEHNTLVMGAHFDFPALGHIKQRDNNFEWQPLTS